MKFFVSIILIALLSFASCLFFPWWTIAIAAAVVSLIIAQKPLASFFAGFIALFLLWGGLSFWMSQQNNHILAHKISVVILKQDNPYLLILVTALIGALVAGFASLAASYIRPKSAPKTI